MSVLIKGMKMPKDGCHHTITIYSDGTVAIGKANNYEAIEVPTPHGRLIDANAIQNEMYCKSFETDDGRQKWDSGLWIRYKIFEEAIADVPTVIESEE